MSYAVNADTVEFYRGRQDHSGGVAVAVCGVSAGSRSAARTRHGRVSRRHQHHLPARPRRPFDQFSFGRTDRRVSGFTCHGRTGEEFRFEVFDRDHLMVCHHPRRPYARGVGVLTSGLLVQPRGCTTRLLVAVAGRLASRPSPARHLALRASEFGGTAFAVTTVGQVVVGVSGGRGALHAPVDADLPAGVGFGSGFAADNETRVPVSEAVAVHPYRGRFRWQSPRPYDRDHHLVRQSEPPLRRGAIGRCSARSRPYVRIHIGGRIEGRLEIKGRSSRLLRQEFPHPHLETTYIMYQFTSSPRSAPQHWRLSNAMSRTKRTFDLHTDSSPRLTPGASSELHR